MTVNRFKNNLSFFFCVEVPYPLCLTTGEKLISKDRLEKIIF